MYFFSKIICSHRVCFLQFLLLTFTVLKRKKSGDYVLGGFDLAIYFFRKVPIPFRKQHRARKDASKSARYGDMLHCGKNKKKGNQMTSSSLRVRRGARNIAGTGKEAIVWATPNSVCQDICDNGDSRRFLLLRRTGRYVTKMSFTSESKMQL